MRRKRRLIEKKSEQKKYLTLPFKDTSPIVRETTPKYSLPEIVNEYTRLLKEQNGKSKQSLQKHVHTNHISQILSKSGFFYREIKTPLRVLDSFLEYIETTIKQTKSTNSMLVTAKHELLNLENLSMYLWLVWSPKIPESEININDVIQRELSLEIKPLRSQNISILTDFAEAPLVTCSRELLGLCLRNIFANIVESAQPNSELSIHTVVSQSVFFAHFTHPVEHDVSEDINRAFRLFETRKPSHIGIGLPLCREIMHVMGGEIYLKMLPGPAVQTTFSIPCD